MRSVGHFVVKMDMEENKTRNRRVWTDEETIAFLKCYKRREWEMSQSRKKMLGYSNILDDLIFTQVPQSAITANNLQSKMNSLLRAYHQAMYIETINGEGSSGFAFMKLMKDIFGSSGTSRSESFASTSTSQSTSRASSTVTSDTANLTSESSPNTLFTCTSHQSTSRSSSILTKARSNLTSASSVFTRAPSSSTCAQSSSNGNLISQDESEESKRRVWKYDKTRALINCFASREEESRHPKKGKNVFKNILTDLESMNVLTAPTIELNVKQKWDRLLDAYKTASDAERLTGRGSSTFMYMDAMDDIFSDRPIMANSHTVNLYGENIQAIPLRPIQKILPVDETDTGNEEESFFRLISPEDDRDINSKEVAYFEQIESSENTESNAKQSESRNALRLLDPKNVAGESSKNIPKDTISNRTTTVASIVKPSVPRNVLRTLATKSIAASSAKNLPTDQTSTLTTLTVAAGEKDTRSLLMTEMGLDVDVSTESSKISQKSTGGKSKKLPYSFRRTKTGKEIAQEKKEKCEGETTCQNLYHYFQKFHLFPLISTYSICTRLSDCTNNSKNSTKWFPPEKWEMEKLKRKSEARMEQIRFLEEKKQKRHEERCKVMATYLEKL